MLPDGGDDHLILERRVLSQELGYEESAVAIEALRRGIAFEKVFVLCLGS